MNQDGFVHPVGGINYEFQLSQRSIMPALLTSSQHITRHLLDSRITRKSRKDILHSPYGVRLHCNANGGECMQWDAV